MLFRSIAVTCGMCASSRFARAFRMDCGAVLNAVISSVSTSHHTTLGKVWSVMGCRPVRSARAARGHVVHGELFAMTDRKSVGHGKSVSVGLILGGCRIIKKKNKS